MRLFYGRRSSRKVNLDEIKDLKNFEFFLNSENLETRIREIKNSYDTFNLEIGFGSGDNILHQAVVSSRDCFLACDPFLNGGIKLKKKIQKLNLKNIFLTDVDFLSFYEYIKEIKFQTIYILFPDPWPKKKHKKRRLINSKFTNLLSNISKPGSSLIISTDHEDYLNQILYCFFLQKEFNFSIKLRDESLKDQFSIKSTKYYLKAQDKKKKTYYLLFQK